MQENWQALLNGNRRKKSRTDLPEKELRLGIEKDYDRSLYSTPVRRLQDKAQVFPLDPNDSVRTRLTHSHEVATLARNLGRTAGLHLAKEKKIGNDDVRIIEFICMTGGLLHDLGNPPFGHAGEVAIQEWFREKRCDDHDIKLMQDPQEVADFINFDGNPQTFRLLTQLQLLDNKYGLNLTYATMGASLKYTAPSHRIDDNNCASKKAGYFKSEESIAKEVWEKLGLKQRQRHPLTFLIEAADDIAYSVIDLEDGLKKSVITWTQIKNLAESSENGCQGFLDILEKAENYLKTSDLGLELSPKHQDDVRAVHFRTTAMREIVGSIVKAFIENLDQIERGEVTVPLEKLCDMEDVIKFAKNISRQHIFGAQNILKIEIKGKKVIHDLLELFWSGVSASDFKGKHQKFHDKIVATMSRNYLDYARLSAQDEQMTTYRKVQLVTDYVCGMTDNFATNLHRELFNG